MKKGFTIFIVCVILTVCIGTMCACNKEQGIKYNIGHSGEGGFAFLEQEDKLLSFSQALILSCDEMKNLSNKWQSGTFDADSSAYNTKLNTKLRTYSDEFFSGKALILFCVWIGEGQELSIKNVTTATDGIYVELNCKTKHGTHLDYAYMHTFLLEVNKSALKDTQNLYIIQR